MYRFSGLILSVLSVLFFIACGDDDSDSTSSSSSASTNGSIATTVTAARTLISNGTTTLNHRVTGLVIGLGGSRGKAFYLYDGTYALQFYPTEAMTPPVAVGQNVSVTLTAGQVFESAILVIGVKDWVVNSTGNAVAYSGSPAISIANQGMMITRTLAVGTEPISAHRSNDWRIELEETYFRNNTGDHSGTAQGITLEAGKTYTISGVVDAYGDKKAVAIFQASLVN